MNHIYVAGLAFDIEKGLVALIRKNRPEWMRGRLSSIGGKVEPGEQPINAMEREFREETGATITRWQHFCTLKGADPGNNFEPFSVYFYRAMLSYNILNTLRSVTDETVVIEALSNIKIGHPAFMPNLPWLIPMALALDFDKADSYTVQEGYFGSPAERKEKGGFGVVGRTMAAGTEV